MNWKKAIVVGLFSMSWLDTVLDARSREEMYKTTATFAAFAAWVAKS